MMKLFYYALVYSAILMNFPGKPPSPAEVPGKEKIEANTFVCNVTANAGDDQTICNPGQLIGLTGMAGGNFTSFSWSPPELVNSPNSLTTTATVFETTTFQLTVQGQSDQNLIFNGDFSAGLSGFTSDYIPGTGGPFGLLSSEGQFAVAANASATHTNFAPCTDHTGGGNMLVVNGAGVPNQNVWCQVISVTPFTNYNFSAWIASVVASSPAILQFSVNGVGLGIFNASPVTCQWNQFTQTWNSGSANSVEICIVNQNTALSGNDFAIDDLFFGELCTATDEVTVTVVELHASWQPPPALCPFSAPVNLNTLLLPWATPGGTWTINGVPNQFFDPLLLGAGGHLVTYTVSQAPCSESSSQFMVIEPLPNVDWAPPSNLCVSSLPVNLSSLLLPGATPGGNWTINGSPATQLDPAQLGSGPHVVTYSAGTPPCVNLLTLVVEIQDLAQVSWTPPASLCETDPAVNLNALLNAGSVSGGVWTINGSPSSNFNPSTLGPGTHSVIYTAGTFPCANSEGHSIVVTGIPNIGWTAPSALCEGDPSFLLDDLLDPGATSGGSWTVNGGTATSFDPAGLGAGSHQVIYTAGPANCQNSLEQTITIGEGPIAAFAVAPAGICLDENAVVTFTGSASAGTVFHWDFGGGIVAPGTGEGPHEVSWPQAGSFTITLWLEEGNCISDTIEHSVAVFAPLDTPVPICGAVTSSSVEATWEAIPGAVSYNLIVLSGQQGSINGTTVVFENLAHGEEVQFIIEAVSGGPCGNSQSDLITCTAQDCIPADIDISEADPVCLDSGTLPFNLQATVSDSTGSGHWSGPGIVDSLAGLFDPAVAGIGSHLISFTYQTDECISSSSVEISVLPVPEAGFILPESICLTDTAQIVFSGTASDSASYNWNFGDGTILSGSQSGPYGISWTDPGVKPVSLAIIDNGCTSPAFTDSLVVSPPLIPPVINCRTTISSIEFYWDPVAGSEVFAVSAIGNLPGTITSDTSVLFANLDPLQEVTVELTFFSVNDCPDIIVSHTCVAEECPDVSLSISPVALVCLAGDSAPFALSVAITGSAGSGSGTWQGPGITDSQAGMFDPSVAMAGTHTIIFTYSEGSCQYSVSTVITVRNTPIASFTHPDAICMDNSAAINFTGTAGGSAVFNWDFGSGSVVSGSGSGSYEISWDTPGDMPVTLQIEENGCVSDIFSGTIAVDAPLEIPQITCSADYTSVEFSWPSLSGAAGFTVNVLQGPPGAILSDTSYLFEGLTPGQEVTLEVTGLSGNNCPDVVQVISCSSVSCPTVNLNILPVDPVCIGQSAVSIPLDFAISGHSATGSLAWSGAGITNPQSGVWTADPSMAGAVNQVYLTYSESVCTFADSLLIEINAIPEAGFSAPGVICIDETASVVFTGANIPGSVYNWNFDSGAADPPGGAGPFEVSWGSAGNYQISLSVEAAGCMSETTVHDIQVDAPLQIPQISCQADFTSMLISWPQVDGAEDYALQINPSLPGSWISDTSFLLENLPAGTNIGFELTVFGNTSCGEVTASWECATLSCPDLALTWQAPSAVCLGMSAAFVFQIEDQGQGPLTVVVASGGDQYVLEGVTNGYTFDLELTQSGDFSIISAMGSGLPDCPVSLPQPLTVSVQQPVEAGVAGPAPEICNNENSIITLADLLGGGDAGGTWSETTQIPSTGGAFNSLAGIFNPIAQAAGLYSFTYTVAAAPPCPDDMAQVQVRVHPAPVADAGQDVALDCLAGVVSLGGANTSAGPGLSYSWTAAGGALISDPASAFTEVSQPDVFTLTVIDLATGCRDQDEVVVDSDVDFLNPHVSISPVSCFQADDGAIQVDSVSGGQGPFSYSLNGGAFTSQSFFNRLAPGEYTLVISDSKGCRSELFFLLEQPDEVQVILAADLEGEERVIQLGDSLRLRAIINIPFEAVDTILWFPDTLGCSGCAELTVAPQQTSTFSVTVIDRNGCSDTDRLTIFVKKIRDVYIPNVFSPNGDGINDVFMIFGGQEAVKVRSFLIFNRWGESVFEAFNFPPNDQSYGWNGNFRGRPMNPGVFVYLTEIEMIDGETLIFKGDFNLLR